MGSLADGTWTTVKFPIINWPDYNNIPLIADASSNDANPVSFYVDNLVAELGPTYEWNFKAYDFGSDAQGWKSVNSDSASGVSLSQTTDPASSGHGGVLQFSFQATEAGNVWVEASSGISGHLQNVSKISVDVYIPTGQGNLAGAITLRTWSDEEGEYFFPTVDAADVTAGSWQTLNFYVDASSKYTFGSVLGVAFQSTGAAAQSQSIYIDNIVLYYEIPQCDALYDFSEEGTALPASTGESAASDATWENGRAVLGWDFTDQAGGSVGWYYNISTKANFLKTSKIILSISAGSGEADLSLGVLQSGDLGANVMETKVVTVTGDKVVTFNFPDDFADTLSKRRWGITGGDNIVALVINIESDSASSGSIGIGSIQFCSGKYQRPTGLRPPSFDWTGHHGENATSLTAFTGRWELLFGGYENNTNYYKLVEDPMVADPQVSPNAPLAVGTLNVMAVDDYWRNGICWAQAGDATIDINVVDWAASQGSKALQWSYFFPVSDDLESTRKIASLSLWWPHARQDETNTTALALYPDLSHRIALAFDVYVPETTLEPYKIGFNLAMQNNAPYYQLSDSHQQGPPSVGWNRFVFSFKSADNSMLPSNNWVQGGGSVVPEAVRVF